MCQISSEGGEGGGGGEHFDAISCRLININKFLILVLKTDFFFEKIEIAITRSIFELGPPDFAW